VKLEANYMKKKARVVGVQVTSDAIENDELEKAI
jgi:hypothetical protein